MDIANTYVNHGRSHLRVVGFESGNLKVTTATGRKPKNGSVLSVKDVGRPRYDSAVAHYLAQQAKARAFVTG